MLEVDPTFAAEKPAIEVHELGIGGKEPPARMVFKSKTGKAVIATVLDMATASACW
jgi:L-arabinose isomerase